MLDLKSVRDFIKETVEVLAIATDMEVIICDNRSMVLGDSNIEETKDMDFRKNLDILSDHSIVRQAIDEGRRIIYSECKRENPACQICVNSSTCLINSIIAIPIKDNGSIIGGIGLYAYNDEGQQLLNKKNDKLIDFVEKISDMLVSKAREKTDKIAIQIANEQLRLLVESLDEAIIGFDSNNTVINANSKLYKLFNIPKKSIRVVEDIYGYFKDVKLYEFLNQCFEKRVPEKAAITFKEEELITLYKPVIVENEYMGGLIYFKKGSDIYKDIKTIKNNYFNVTFRDIAGKSEKMIKLKESAEHFAKGPSNIFIQGKSGTGKEMFARAIHNASLVSNGPFIVINCAAIPENLMESELFGHKEGAFTGSMKGGQVGKFQLADKGTLFLDEIGEMPIHLQPKLLRAIQEKRIQPIGSNEYKIVNIRIIAATNKVIEEMIEKGEFREDLYYRLNVIPLYIPELKERKTDIPILLDLFLDKFNSMLDKNILDFDETSRSVLSNYEWPGNIRELQNVVEYAVNDCSGQYIVIDNLPKKFLKGLDSNNFLKIQPLRDIEEYYIREALKVYGNTYKGKSDAAKALGISRSTFYRRLAYLGLDENYE